ncbi:MAG TPA: two-component regulator propeller domain-containing protein [Anaerolineaceae bacterium]|nr:two-component regulator propeller domain-containing protein [Anaerolineaceae bacterium]HPN50829.1 two-component regulator propeller domain-containing protein [Anaerolineaceae bacterium]
MLWLSHNRLPMIALVRAFLAAGLVLLLTGCAASAVQLPSGEINSVIPISQLDGKIPIRSGTLRFEHISVDEGLSESVVQVILQDRMGFLWFGTEDGLNRFDGYNFIVFKNDPGNLSSISQNNITAIYEDHLGNIWIGTQRSGLNRYDSRTGTFTRYGVDDNLSDSQVTCILEDSEGTLWVGTKNGGLNQYDRASGNFIAYQFDLQNRASVSSNNITTLYEDRFGNFWVGTDRGLDKMDRSIRTFSHFRNEPQNPTSLSNNYVNFIFQDGRDVIWVGTMGGLNMFLPETGQFIHYQNKPGEPHSLSNNKVKTMIEDGAGILWIGTLGGGINRYDEKNDWFDVYNKNRFDPTSLSDDRVLSLLEDRSGILWAGTADGINKLGQGYKNFRHFFPDPENINSLGYNQVSAIKSDSLRRIWFGTDGGGVDVYSPETGRFEHYQHDPADPNSLSNNHVRSLAVDPDGTLWVGTALGLHNLDPETAVVRRIADSYDDQNQPIYNIITSLVIDREGILWVATDGNGISKYDLGTKAFIGHYLHDDRVTTSVSSNHINVVFVDKANTIWVGTPEGLDRFDRSTRRFIHYKYTLNQETSLSDDNVLSLFEDRLGMIWVGTSGGLNRLDPVTGQIIQYREKDGLPDETISSILEDDRGIIWISTNRGIIRFDPIKIAFKSYDVKDGLQSNEFKVDSGLKTADGTLFFGGMNGVTVFRPEEIRDNPYIPPVVLTAFLVEGSPIVTTERIEKLNEVVLYWPNNSIEFEFTALSFARSEANQYAYYLEGFDNGWNYVGTRRDGRYTNLPGKTYILHLKAANEDGVWNNEGVSLLISVVPPFWETPIFQIIISISIVMLLFFGYRMRLRGIEDRNRLLERQVGDRTREIKHRNQELEALYRADEIMHRFLTIDQVLQALVDVAVDFMKAEKSAVFTWEENHTQIEVKVFRGWRLTRGERWTVAEGEGILGRNILQGEAIVILDTDFDLRWRDDIPKMIHLIISEELRSIIYVPIKIEEKIWGIFIVGSRRAHAFDEDAQRLFLALAQRATISIDNAILFEQTKELAIIEERNRLARDLHDSAKQKAFAALAQLGAANGILARSPDSARGHVGEAENLVYEVIQELTFLIQEMYPIALKEKGLSTALREYIFEWENRTGIFVQTSVDSGQVLSIQLEQALYRVAQESLANIARHSQAQTVGFNLEYKPDVVEMTIFDDGIGFDLGQKPSGVGLRSMQERIAMVGGIIEINSTPNKGTRIFVQVPIDKHIYPSKEERS